jgi:hypothetical protein
VIPAVVKTNEAAAQPEDVYQSNTIILNGGSFYDQKPFLPEQRQPSDVTEHHLLYCFPRGRKP